MSVILIAFLVAIEVKPISESIIFCKAESENFKTNESYIPEDANCREFLTKLFDRELFMGIYYTLFITSIVSTLFVVFLHALVTTEDHEKKYVFKCWIAFIALFMSFFAVLLVSAFYGYHIFLRAVPCLIGVPLMICIPIYFGLMTQFDSLKSVFELGYTFIIAYYMVVINIVVMAAYIIWEPSNYAESYRRGTWILSSAYYFSVIAGIGFSLEVEYGYTMSKYNEQNSNQDNKLIKNKLISLIVDNIESIITGAFVRCIFIWLSVSSIGGNITILGFIIFYPIIMFIGIKIKKNMTKGVVEAQNV